MPASTRTPVHILTGFLGSGKTTLLNRLIRARPPSPGKLAIIVNELGAVGIDGDLLPSSMTRQVELPGGCICCLLNEELDKTLLDLLSATPDVETVVIETTGIAEPLPIAWSLAREPISEHVRLASVITVVDIIHFQQNRPLGPAVDAQVEYADILVLSKLDLIESGRVPAELDTILGELNPDALRVAGSPDQIAEILWTSLADPALPDTADELPRSLRVAKDERGHGHGFDTTWLPIENTLDFEILTEELESLPARFVRIKGIARVIDASTGSSAPRWIAFHRVGIRVSSEPLATPGRARIVAVGPGVDPARLAACLEASVVPCES